MPSGCDRRVACHDVDLAGGQEWCDEEQVPSGDRQPVSSEVQAKAAFRHELRQTSLDPDTVFTRDECRSDEIEVGPIVAASGFVEEGVE